MPLSPCDPGAVEQDLRTRFEFSDERRPLVMSPHYKTGYVHVVRQALKLGTWPVQ